MSEESHSEKPVSDWHELAKRTQADAASEQKAGAESPTTARELDFDDDQDESKPLKSPTPKPKVSFAEDEAPPSKPPRPLSPQSQKENTLKEAFPSIDVKVIRAVLTASGGNVEPAFNALLGIFSMLSHVRNPVSDPILAMSDPDFKPEEAPPARPPRPTQQQRQLEADEHYARQLAQHFQSSDRPQRGSYDDDERGPPLPNRPRQQRPGLGEDDREYSFFDGTASCRVVPQEKVC